MSGDRQPGYDAVIPARVRYDPALKDKAKLLYGEIRALASRDGFCWATNEYFCRLYDVSDRTVQRLLSDLSRRGHIFTEVLRDEATHAVIERRIWVDRGRFLRRDRDLPPQELDEPPHDKIVGTPPDKTVATPPDNFVGTPPDNFVGENSTSMNNTREEDPPKPPKGGRGSRRKAPDWKPERFEKFWGFYPRCASNANQKKADARRAWNQLKPDDELIAYMGKVLAAEKKSPLWQEGRGVPYASTWIRKFREEELPDLETLISVAEGTGQEDDVPDAEYTGGLSDKMRQELLYGSGA